MDAHWWFSWILKKARAESQEKSDMATQKVWLTKIGCDVP